jgi:hypothetical protein
MTMAYTISDFRRDIRQPYAWPGGYPMFFLTSDGEALSFAAAKSQRRNVLEAIAGGYSDGWRVVGVNVNWENADLTCAHTGEAIGSAYA